jgi:hypothetical protein
MLHSDLANPRFQEKFTLLPDAEDYLSSLTDGLWWSSSVLKYIHDVSFLHSN